MLDRWRGVATYRKEEPMATTEVFEDLLRELQGVVGRYVKVEVGSRDPAGRPNYLPGQETIYATFCGVLERGHSHNGAVTFVVGEEGELPLDSDNALSCLPRERNYRRSIEIMSRQPVVVWVTPLPDEQDV
jgi:hypothetical protein